jgi:hypothetical protein
MDFEELLETSPQPSPLQEREQEPKKSEKKN